MDAGLAYLQAALALPMFYRHTECPLSVAQDILENGFIIGNSEAMWFCTRGLIGYGRFHAQDRSRHETGWTENGKAMRLE